MSAGVLLGLQNRCGVLGRWVGSIPTHSRQLNLRRQVTNLTLQLGDLSSNGIQFREDRISVAFILGNCFIKVAIKGC